MCGELWGIIFQKFATCQKRGFFRRTQQPWQDTAESMKECKKIMWKSGNVLEEEKANLESNRRNEMFCFRMESEQF
jgi:hypothetical protein